MEIPGLPRSTKPFAIFQSLPVWKSPDKSSGTFRGLTHCFSCGAGIYRRCRQSAPSRPLGGFGSGRLLLGAEAGRLDSVRRVTLYPFWGAALGPSPRHLSGGRTERLGDHISNHHPGESKGEGEVLEKILGRGEERYLLDPGRRPQRNPLAPAGPHLL